FIHDLFAKVIFPEARLASLDAGTARQLAWRRRGLYAGALGSVLLMLGVWLNAFSDNQARLDQLRRIAEQLPQAREQLPHRADVQPPRDALDASHAATPVCPGPDEL